MSEEDLKNLLNKNIEISEKIYESMEKQRKIRMWTLIIGIAVIVLPLIAALFILPSVIGDLGNYYGEIIDL